MESPSLEMLKKRRYGTSGRDLVATVGMAWQLDFMILEVFSNFNDSVILRHSTGVHKILDSPLFHWRERANMEDWTKKQQYSIINCTKSTIFALIWRKWQFLLKHGNHNYPLSHPKIAVTGANKKTAIPSWGAPPLPCMRGIEREANSPPSRLSEEHVTLAIK